MSGQLSCQDHPVSCYVLWRQNCYKYVPVALGISSGIPTLDIAEIQTIAPCGQNVLLAFSAGGKEVLLKVDKAS